MRSVFNFLGLLLIVIAGRTAFASDISYNRDIRPLLSDRCFACHGPDEAKREANLRLDISTGDESPFQVRDGHQAIKAGAPTSSELWKRLTTEDESLRMPPRDSIKKPLTAEQSELIRRWITQGATYDDFWSFVPPKPQTLPRVEHSDWIAHPIDQFVLANLESKQLKPQPAADKRTLIRRVTLDLTGSASDARSDPSV